MSRFQENIQSSRRTGSIEFFIEERDENRVISRMPVAEGMLNPFGTVQAGAMPDPLYRGRREHLDAAVSGVNDLVVVHHTVAQAHGSVRGDLDPLAASQARAEHQRVQQVAFEADVVGNRAVIERTRQRGDEIQLAKAASFQEAPLRDLDHDWKS